MECNIVCASDNNFYIHMSVMLKSIEINSSLENINIYILNSTLSDDNKNRIKNWFEKSKLNLRFVSVNNYIFLHCKTTERLSSATYYRLLIPELLPDSINKVIYLDSDLLVEGDIKELWEIEIGDLSLLAVAEVVEKLRYVSSSAAIAKYKELGIPKDKKYFNAGVLVMNLERWRKNKIGECVLHYLKKYKKYVRYCDQDGLNAVLWDEWGELPAEWNVMTPIFRTESWKESFFDEEKFNDLKENPKIIHFSGDIKPWTKEGIHPMEKIYFKYLELLKQSRRINGERIRL